MHRRWSAGGRLERERYLAVSQLEMFEDVTDDGGVFDTGDDLYGATAVLADFDVDLEDALEALCPSHRPMAFGRGLGWIAASPAPRGGDLLSQSVVGGEHAVVAGEVDPRRGDEGGESCDEVQWLEYDIRCTVGDTVS